MELKNALFSPNSVIRTPTFRTKGSITFAYSFAFIFLACTIIFLFGNSHVHQSSSQWFKNVIKNRSQLSSYFPRHNHLYHHQNLSNISKDTVFNPELNQSRVSSNGSRNATLSEGKSTAAKKKKKKKRWVELMSKCDVFDGKWVRDDSPPLYEPGSCPFIDESFNCYLNGRPDTGYEKLRWQPNHCNVPRW